MKSHICLPLALLVTIFSCFCITSLNAQEKGDLVIILNGDRNEGKVLEILDNSIKFKYHGEDLEYEFKKAEIKEIEFASGRTQVFNDASHTSATSNTSTSTPEERKNKIAVLPFDYITNDPNIPVDEMHTRIQTSCLNSIRANTAGLTPQDPMTTNAILAQHNITGQNLKTIMPKDMAELLGVEYVVYGVYDLQNKGTFTTGSGATTYKEKESKSNDKNKKSNSGTAYSSSSTSTSTNYEARVDLNIYNDQGKSIYAGSREPLLADPESYTSTLDYMIKRTPFGTKHK